MTGAIQILAVGLEPDMLTAYRKEWAKHGGECHAADYLMQDFRDIVDGQYDLVAVYIPDGEDHKIIRQIEVIRGVSDVLIIASASHPINSELQKDVLEAGADQYHPSPMNMEDRVIVSRALIRRHMELDKREQPLVTVIIRGPLTVSVEQRIVFEGDEEVELLPKEFDILCLLMRYPGYWYSPNEIYEKVWKDIPLENTPELIRIHISRLRDKLKLYPDLPVFIISQRGVGYCFNRKLNTSKACKLG